jgi:hypothetical protein
MGAPEFWATAWAGVISGVVATLVSTVIIWLVGKFMPKKSAPPPSPSQAPPVPPPPLPSNSMFDNSASDGSIAIGQVSGGTVDARVDNRRKKVTKTTTTTTNISNGSSSGSASSSDGDWIWLGVAVLAILGAALVFVRWSEYAFLVSCALFGLTLGAFLGTLVWPLARKSWNPGATLLVVQSAFSTAAFVLIWVGVFNVEKGGWSLGTMRVAIEAATNGVPFAQLLSPILNALGAAGVQLALALLAAALSSVALTLFLGRSVVDWWKFLAAASGRVKKRHAKRYRRFAKPDGWAIVVMVVVPIVVAAIGIASAWAITIQA